MSNLTISIFGNKILLEIINEMKLFPKFKIKYYKDPDLCIRDAKEHNLLVICFVGKKNLKIVDLTGAGDLFAAGFLHGHINNLSVKKSLEKGTEMSSKIIQKIGARLN